MPLCPNCGTNNLEGVKFCVACGEQVGAAPPPESWRASSELGAPPPHSAPDDPASGQSAGGYAPPQSNYPARPPQPPGVPYYQPGPAAGQQMHPAVPAIVSFFLPGIGLLFVPNKVGLGLGIFAGFLALSLFFVIFAVLTLGLGACLAPLLIVANVGAAIHSWDEAAKASNGQFQPILFK
jgi:zinc-ribbon domain